MSSIWERSIELTQQLVRFQSVSHVSNESVSQFVADQLAAQGFAIEWLSYLDDEGVTKVSVVGKRGEGTGGIAYLAHTDVVPADDWSVDFCGPFEPTEKEGKLFGRGTCDMKGSLATALVAASAVESNEAKPLYFVVTSDEEVGMIGAKHVNEHSKFFQEMVAHQTVGIVGEPTSLGVVHAHKGALRFHIIAKGKSAHTSTTDGINANYSLIPALPELLRIRHESEELVCYKNAMFDPPTLSWNMTILNEPAAVNVTASLAILVNFIRAMPGVDHEPLMDRVAAVCDEYGLQLMRTDSVEPWSVDSQAPWIQKMLDIVGETESRSVCYATDAGVLQRLKSMLVCGPGDIQQAHRSDEWISLSQLKRGVEIYTKTFIDRLS